MTNANLDRFIKSKLTKKDLDEYSLKLNDVYNSYSLANEELWNAKQKLGQKQISKEAYKKIKDDFDKQEVVFNDIKSTKSFKNNLSNIAKIYRRADKNSADYLTIKKEYLEARQLYKDFKDVVHDRGKYGPLNKLNDIAISVKNVDFRYADDQPVVLKDMSFDIKQGEYVTVVGHNGSGKSTLSKLLIGVISPDAGEISIFGNSMNNANIERIRQFIGIVFQNPDNQFIGSTVQDDIAFGLENKRINPSEMPGIIKRAATTVGMQDYLNKEPLMLSGGQKQRVAIASTLALNPDIIIFDEATSMLDPKGKKEIKDIMVKLKDRGDKTIISITHDMDEILNATKVLVLNEGKAVRMGAPKDIMSDREFLQSIHLEMPFVGIVEEELKKQGLDIKNGATSMDRLVDEICKTKISK